MSIHDVVPTVIVDVDGLPVRINKSRFDAGGYTLWKDEDDNDGGEVHITEAARTLAESVGIDVSTVEGTGKDGTVTKGDVQAAIENED